MLENIIIYREAGQTTNPKLQISNKLQIPNIKSQIERGVCFLLFVDWLLFFGFLLVELYSSERAYTLRRRAPWLRRAESESIHSLSLRDTRSLFGACDLGFPDKDLLDSGLSGLRIPQ